MPKKKHVSKTSVQKKRGRTGESSSSDEEEEWPQGAARSRSNSPMRGRNRSPTRRRGRSASRHESPARRIIPAEVWAAADAGDLDPLSQLLGNMRVSNHKEKRSRIPVQRGIRIVEVNVEAMPVAAAEAVEVVETPQERRRRIAEATEARLATKKKDGGTRRRKRRQHRQ